MPDVTVTPTLYISTIAPPAPLAGDLWWNSAIGVFFVYYDDGNSAQWVTTQPVKYINLAEIKGPAGGDLTGYYPDPTIIDNVVLEYPELRNPLTLPDYSQRLASTKWVTDKFAESGVLGFVTEGPGILLTPNPLAGDSTIALKALSPAVSPGPYGAANKTAVFELNIYGQVTAASEVAIPPVNSPVFTGTPAGPTAAPGTNTTQFATTAFVQAGIGALSAIYAPINSPVFTGTPTSPTPPSISDGLQIATTEWVRDRLDATVVDTTLNTLAALRALTVAYQSVFVKGLTNENDGWGGVFVLDTSDTTSPDDGALCIVSAVAGRYKRIFNGLAYFRWWQALGNGVADDFAKLTAALNAQATYGFRLSGEGLIYALAGNLFLPDNAYIQDATFFQLDPENAGRRTLTSNTQSKGTTLIRVKVDRNGTPTSISTVADASGIWMVGSESAKCYFEDVEVTGSGPGRAMLFGAYGNVTLIRPYVHDMYWWAATDPGSGGEKIGGIQFTFTKTVYIEDPQIHRLMGWFGTGELRPYQTDGMNISHCSAALVRGGMISYCGEGFDGAGSEVSHNVWFDGTMFSNCGAGHKIMTHRNSGAVNCDFFYCGLASIITVSNGTLTDAVVAKNNRYADCRIYNSGALRTPPVTVTRGVWAETDGGPALENIRFDNVSAVASEATTTGSIAGTVMTVATPVSGEVVKGQFVAGTGVTAGTYIWAEGKAAAIIGTISGNNNLTVSTVNYGAVAVGQLITGPGILPGTFVLSGAGSNWIITNHPHPNVTNGAMLLSLEAPGQFTVTPSQTVASTALTMTSNMSYGFYAGVGDDHIINDFSTSGASVADTINVTTNMSTWEGGNFKVTGGLEATAPSDFAGFLSRATSTFGSSAGRFLRLTMAAEALTLIEQRGDDNANRIFYKLQNFGITAANQGANFAWEFGTGSAFAAVAGTLSLLTSDTWGAAANRSAKWRLQTISANNLSDTIDVAPNGVVVRPTLGIQAGGVAGLGYMFHSVANYGIFPGSGPPTLAAAQGSLYPRSDGSGLDDRLYVNTDGATGWVGVFTGTPSFINSVETTVNFAVGNTNFPISIPRPAGYSRSAILRIVLSEATASMVGGTFGVFTAAGGAGTAIVATGTPCTINTNAEDTNNNMQIPVIVNSASNSWTLNQIHFFVQTAVAASCKVTVSYEPVS